jgi:glycosyltransferase involved in cell wall biosynthesis
LGRSRQKKAGRIISLLWGPFGFRADELASSIGAERVSVTFLYGPRYFAPLRYLVLFFRTLLILFREGPQVVYAQNPPVFCPLTCLLYCNLTATRLVIDHHSIWRVKTLGRGPVSRLIGMLEAVVARRAYANTAPHRFWARQLRAMGARKVLVVHDFVARNPRPRNETLRSAYSEGSLIAISSHGGHPLERMEDEALGVGRVEGVRLIITGPTAKLERRLRESNLPPNVRYLGFLERETYEQLKASADMAINITDEPYTLSHVLLEFAASSLPIISSKQDAVEDFFGDSLLYVASSNPAAIAEKVTTFKDEGTRHEYKQRIESRYSQLESSNKAQLESLRRLFIVT